MEVMIEGDLLESKEELFEIGDESQIVLLWLLFPISIECLNSMSANQTYHYR